MSAEQLYRQLLAKIDEGIAKLLMYHLEWRKKEIQIMATMVTRMARRLEARRDEIRYKVKRVWQPMIVASRWGIEPPDLEKPTLRLVYPGARFPRGSDEWKRWYHTVYMWNRITASGAGEVDIPAVPFKDMIKFDPRSLSGDVGWLVQHVHFIEVVFDRYYNITNITAYNAYVNVTTTGGKTVIRLVPYAFLTERIWDNNNVVACTYDNLWCVFVSETPAIAIEDVASVSIDRIKTSMLAPFVVSIESPDVPFGGLTFDGMIAFHNVRAKIGIKRETENLTWYVYDEEAGIFGFILRASGVEHVSVMTSGGSYYAEPVVKLVGTSPPTQIYACALMSFEAFDKHHCIPMNIMV